MEEVTRELLVEWFGTDNNISDDDLFDLNRQLWSGRMVTFQEFGFEE